MSGRKRKIVSIVSISYNHEKFIKKALDSFLFQNLDERFDIEIIIADDASTDNTQAIISEYAQKHPSIIKPILRRKNVGVVDNLIDAMNHSTGDYLALCEGDDYWTDPEKIRIQYDFMEKHPDYSVCFHRVQVITEGETENTLFPPVSTRLDLTTGGLIDGNFIQTNTVMYRKMHKYKTPELDILPLDWYLHILHARNGSIGFIDRVMSVYLRHSQGVWWRDGKETASFWKRNAVKQFDCFDEIRDLFLDNADLQRKIDHKVSETIITMLRETKGDETAENLLKKIITSRPRILDIFLEGLPLIISKNEKDIQDLLRVAEKRFIEIQRLRIENDQLRGEAIKLQRTFRQKMIERLMKRK